MITQLEVRGFRALRDVSISLGTFQVLVGPNASGKSTFFDVLAFVRDVLTAGIEGALYGSSRLAIPMRAVDPLDVTWCRQGGPIEIALTIQIPEEIQPDASGFRWLRYELAISKELQFSHEVLWLYRSTEQLQVPSRVVFPEDCSEEKALLHHTTPKGWRKVVSKTESGGDFFHSENSQWNNIFRLGPGKSALANLPEDTSRFPLSIWCKRLLMEETCVLALNAALMRMPSGLPSPTYLLPDGSNLAWVVYHLSQQHPTRFGDWVAHVRTSLPDIREIRTCEKPENRSRYLEVVYENGLQAPSWVLSDGTLRMMALTLLAYAPRSPRTMLIEEPENGIHPQAVETVLQSLQSLYDSQVFLATHSPLVLGLVKREQLLCFGKTAHGAIDIVQGSQHPALQDWQSAIHLGDLLALGVLG